MPGVSYRSFVDPSGGSGTDSFALAVAHAEMRGGRRIAVIDVIRERRPPFSPAEATAELAALVLSYGLAEAVRRGTQLVLAAGASVETSLVAVGFEPAGEVTGVDADGSVAFRMGAPRPGDQDPGHGDQGGSR